MLQIQLFCQTEYMLLYSINKSKNNYSVFAYDHLYTFYWSLMEFSCPFFFSNKCYSVHKFYFMN